jgi:four helix bundle protein
MFDFENLDVYKLALDFAKQIAQATETAPRGHWSLVDQFRRASTSIALNIAEGAGRYAKGEKKQFYSIAKGSGYECVPLISLFCDLGLIDRNSAAEWKEKLQRISQMLTKLIQSLKSE